MFHAVSGEIEGSIAGSLRKSRIKTLRFNLSSNKENRNLPITIANASPYFLLGQHLCSLKPGMLYSPIVCSKGRVCWRLFPSSFRHSDLQELRKHLPFCQSKYQQHWLASLLHDAHTDRTSTFIKVLISWYHYQDVRLPLCSPEMDEFSYRILLFIIVRQYFPSTDLFHVNRNMGLDYIFKRHAHCDKSLNWPCY